MVRPWSRKRSEETEPTPGSSEASARPAEDVNLADEDHAWWAQTDVAHAWKPKVRKAPAPQEPGLLAEHYGDDWRTNFLPPPPTQEELAAEAARAQQAIDDQDPYLVLDVDPSATWDEIVAAHRHQARVHHPDRLFGQSEEEQAEGEDRIRVVNAAYQELRVRRGK